MRVKVTTGTGERLAPDARVAAAGAPVTLGGRRIGTVVDAHATPDGELELELDLEDGISLGGLR